MDFFLRNNVIYHDNSKSEKIKREMLNSQKE